MDRNLIVFYSRTGTTRQAAQQLQQLTQWPIAEVRELRARVGFSGDLRCVIDSLLARPAPFVYEGPALGDYDRVVLLTPIWLGHMASPLRGFLADQFHDVRKARPALSLVCVMGGRGAFRAAAEVATIADHCPAPTLALREDEVLSGASFKSLQSLVASVQALESTSKGFRPHWLSPEAA